jgi:putative heme-binding domain-containing protein
MFGALYVVADVNAYEADPEGYAKAHGLEPLDDLLKFNRPRKEWTLDELAGAVTEMQQEGHRSFGNGKQIFAAANCIACHRLNDVGLVMGPDLSKLDPEKMPPLEVLKHILDPSLRIEEKYATNIIALSSGKVVSGMVLEENDQQLTLIENPLAKTPPVTVRKSEIEEREQSKVSIMPKGLLDKLTLTEILDLIAYVSAQGKEEHPLFR